MKVNNMTWKEEIKKRDWKIENNIHVLREARNLSTEIEDFVEALRQYVKSEDDESDKKQARKLIEVLTQLLENNRKSGLFPKK